MGGGGFAQHAKNVTENNRALLRSKRRSKRTKEDVYGKLSITKLQFKKSTPEAIARIKKDMVEEHRFHGMVLLISTFIFLGFITFLIWWLS